MGRNLFAAHPVFSLFPSIWLCCTLVSSIINYTSYVNLSENICDMLAIMFLLLFVFAQAKLAAKQQIVRSGKGVYAFGFSAMLFVGVTALPNLFFPDGRMGHYQLTGPDIQYCGSVYCCLRCGIPGRAAEDSGCVGAGGNPRAAPFAGGGTRTGRRSPSGGTRGGRKGSSCAAGTEAAAQSTQMEEPEEDPLREEIVDIPETPGDL